MPSHKSLFDKDGGLQKAVSCHLGDDTFIRRGTFLEPLLTRPASQRPFHITQPPSPRERVVKRAAMPDPGLRKPLRKRVSSTLDLLLTMGASPILASACRVSVGQEYAFPPSRGAP